MIGVIGESGLAQDSLPCRIAFQVGRRLVESGFRMCCGGLSGVMSAALAGAHAADNYREGDTVGIIPKLDHDWASPHADIVIATGLGHARNVLVANSDAVVVVGGGSGTLSEAALAWSFRRLIIALPEAGGVSEKIAGDAFDGRRKDIPALSKVWPAASPEEVVALLKEHLPACTLKPPEFDSYTKRPAN